MREQAYEQLTLFPVDSPASHFLLPGSDEAKEMTVTSGRKCSELFKSSSPLGLLAKMLLESSTWHSTRCFLAWKAKVTKQERLYFRLAASMPRIKESECVSWDGRRSRPAASVLWRTPTVNDAINSSLPPSQIKRDQLTGQIMRAMWPTPTSRSGTGPSQTGTRQGGMDLQTAAALWPTPTVTGNHNHPGSSPKAGMGLSTAARLFQPPTTGAGLCGGTGNGGQLNPEWVEAMMGFPLGWTRLEQDGRMEAGKQGFLA